MALLTLKDIGKIYVSEGNVAIGIRGVNLSFDRGEFVAVTGKSGSGKSTLLNVISGMDTYEEGELFIEGQPTSHYLQPEWEDYRQEYISFIFQDYNIIDSYTALQNVELALLHIDDKRERRRRALELLSRVGMSKFIHQKGSRLSGGQKQRTVIARALAKDSPIILADEPTGNLDSATSKEIIDLLREVSQDKLLIIVTHNFEQVEHCATRHIRIFDGAVESDHILSENIPASAPADADAPAPASKDTKKKKASARSLRHKDVSHGITLGHSMFTSRPRLSLFMCMLMIIGTLGVFFVTAICGDISELFEKNYMFRHIDGRVVLTHQDGTPITEEELSSLAAETGAKDLLHYDILLDNQYIFLEIGDYWESFNLSYREDFGEDIVGRYPTARNEVFLSLPISAQEYFGKDTLPFAPVLINQVPYTVVGLRYHYDNNLTPTVLMTKQGFTDTTAAYFISQSGGGMISVKSYSEEDPQKSVKDLAYCAFSSTIESGKIYYHLRRDTKEQGLLDGKAEIFLHALYYDYSAPSYYDTPSTKEFSVIYDETYLTATEPEDLSSSPCYFYGDASIVCFSVDLINETVYDVLEKTYRQASLFYENDKAAHAAAEILGDRGYLAVPSDTTYSEDSLDTILNTVALIFIAIAWFIAILFFAFLIYLCSSRTLGAFRGDMAIMRSMGIPVKVIRIGIVVRMLISLIPAYILVIASAFFIYTNPEANAYFTYLYLWQYVLIFIGMLILTLMVTKKQIHKLFGESVKKALKGGATA